MTRREAAGERLRAAGDVEPATGDIDDLPPPLVLAGEHVGISTAAPT